MGTKIRNFKEIQPNPSPQTEIHHPPYKRKAVLPILNGKEPPFVFLFCGNIKYGRRYISIGFQATHFIECTITIVFIHLHSSQ